MDKHQDTTPLRLHIGCGDRILPGFVNIDIIPGAELQLDARNGLPFPDESCDYIFSEHFIEHLSQSEGTRLMREMRRVLKPGGVVRLATPDLQGMADDYQQQRIHEDWLRFGYSWTRTGAERFNLGMREWGHKWVYDQEELQRVAALAGLECQERCSYGESRHEILRNLEHRIGSRLILEFTKQDRRLAADATPMVSIPIPAYRATYFEAALTSALTQTWKNLEIIVCDDCPDDSVAAIVHKYESDSRLRYIRNPQNLGGYQNLIQCLEVSQGEFVKFLNDDDLLAPDCIERFLEAFRTYPDVTLAFSKRHLIDAQGIILPDEAFNARLSNEDCLMDGQGLAASAVALAANIIGEPSTVMCRRSDLAKIKPHFMTFGGYEQIRVVNDLAAWFNLLSIGNAAYFAAPLSSFRRHAEQRQMAADIPELAGRGWQQLSDAACRLGLASFEKLEPLKSRKADQQEWAADIAQPINRAMSAIWTTPTPNAKEDQEESVSKPAMVWNNKTILNAWSVLTQPEILETGPQPVSMESNYSLWLQKHSLEEIHAEVHAERMVTKWPHRPRFLMLMPIRQGEQERVAKTIGSLEKQLYNQWQIIFIADFDAPSPIFSESDVLGWLRLDTMEDEELLANAVNALIAEVPCEWLTLLPAGAEFEPNLLLALGDYAFLHRRWHAIYTDHDQIAANGHRYAPKFKPDFNLDYLRSMDYIGPSCWFRRESLLEVGGLTPYPGAWHYDAIWRLHDQVGPDAIGHIAEPLLHLPNGAGDHPLAQASRQVSVENHLARLGIPATVQPGAIDQTVRIEYAYDQSPLVSIIIPNRDAVWYLKPCLEGLFEKTDYANFEVIIVDNQTDDPDTLDYYDELTRRYGEQVRVVAYDHPFNFSAQCNLGAQASRGEYLLLLNNDTEIVQSNWLSRLVSYALRPEVGAVGARLVLPENAKIQHAGVIVGMDRLASHGFMLQDMNEAGYMNRLQVDQNYSAVTAACMLIRRSIYEDVGGMDAEHAPVLFNDVDLSLKIREADYLIVWTPSVTLVHHESKSLATEAQTIQRRANAYKRDAATADVMHQRWKKWIGNDPAYNRHLCLNASHSFTVDPVLVADWDRNFHDRKRVLSFPLAGGVGEYRFIAPLKSLSREGRLQPTLIQTKKYHELRYPTMPELTRLDPDILMQQVDYSAAFLEWQEFYRKHRPDMLSIMMIDDLITHMPEDNPNYRIIPRDGRSRLRKLFKHCDRVIVSTQPLFDFVKELTDEVRLVPNTLRDDLWGHLTSQRRVGKKPRVGWAGAQQHKGDLAIITEAVKQTADEVEWVFFGMCPDEIRPYVAEYHQFEVGVEAYPAKLAALNLDLAVAPLELHPFNEAKSNLRLLEYGVLGLPVVCTDIYPYRTDDAPVTRVANETDAWVNAIRERVHDLDAAAREGDTLRQWVRQNYMLSGQLDNWFRALTDPRR
ncbi:glycosyltransferase [Azospira sp. APE16]|uniref:glycosyltransferase n=1 Tax=Azospira sp. APE16 TaxID=3394231 RepID=UPI003A4D773E